MICYEVPKVVGELALEENGLSKHNIYTPELTAFLKILGVSFGMLYRFLFYMDVFDRAIFL